MRREALRNWMPLCTLFLSEDERGFPADVSVFRALILKINGEDFIISIGL